MGISNLTKLIQKSSNTIRSVDLNHFRGKKIVFDANQSLYQFLSVMPKPGQALTDPKGNTTSHLQGTFWRTVKMVENGIKPIFVFDGMPPEAKRGEIQRRREMRRYGEFRHHRAKDEGDEAEADKWWRVQIPNGLMCLSILKRSVRVRWKHAEEVKQLLKMMGLPVITAPGEAEAQCAVIAASGLADATASEDMDSLAFGSPKLVRHLYGETKKVSIREINLQEVLQELEITYDQLVDLCILLGCDYSDTIKGIGPVHALEYIKQHQTIEEIIKHLDPEKFEVPEDFDPQKIRDLFKNPLVTDPSQLELHWTEPQEREILQFMTKERIFNPDRMMQGIETLKTGLALPAIDKRGIIIGKHVMKDSTQSKELENFKTKLIEWYKSVKHIYYPSSMKVDERLMQQRIRKTQKIQEAMELKKLRLLEKKKRDESKVPITNRKVRKKETQAGESMMDKEQEKNIEVEEDFVAEKVKQEAEEFETMTPRRQRRSKKTHDPEREVFPQPNEIGRDMQKVVNKKTIQIELEDSTLFSRDREKGIECTQKALNISPTRSKRQKMSSQIELEILSEEEMEPEVKITLVKKTRLRRSNQLQSDQLTNEVAHSTQEAAISGSQSTEQSELFLSNRTKQRKARLNESEEMIQVNLIDEEMQYSPKKTRQKSSQTGLLDNKKKKLESAIITNLEHFTEKVEILTPETVVTKRSRKTAERSLIQATAKKIQKQ